MANILDYLVWRGDLLLDDFPFNEIDNLILSELVYMDWTGIVPQNGTDSIPLHQAAQLFFEKNPRDNLSLGVLIPKTIFDLTLSAALSPRFRDLRLGDFVNIIDHDAPTQFAAMTVTGCGDRTVIVYRGTDDTLAGWWEDFNMSYLEYVPAQAESVRYLNEQATLHPESELIVCGHSKGGNLAVFASAYCREEVQDRILRVYNNDGPGFLRKPTQDEGYLRIRERITTFLPQNSVVGILLQHDKNFEIVTSSTTGASQHDGMTWQVYGTKFSTVSDLTLYSRQTEMTLHSWLYSMSVEDRRAMVQGLFTILRETGAKTLGELQTNRMKTARLLVDRLKAMDGSTKERTTHIIKLLLRGQAKSLGTSITSFTQTLQNNKP